MDSPKEFSPQARARIEAERLKAIKDLEQARKKAPWYPNGPSREDEKNFRRYVLRVFLAFIREACEHSSQGRWSVDHIRREGDRFLHQFAHEAYWDQGYDKDGRRLREMFSHLGTGMKLEVEREFHRSDEWRKYEELLLAVAEHQAAEANHGERDAADGRTGPQPAESALPGSLTSIECEAKLGKVGPGAALRAKYDQLLADAEKRLGRKVKQKEFLDYVGLGHDSRNYLNRMLDGKRPATLRLRHKLNDGSEKFTNFLKENSAPPVK